VPIALSLCEVISTSQSSVMGGALDGEPIFLGGAEEIGGEEMGACIAGVSAGRDVG
jgi:hypothetical protein